MFMRYHGGGIGHYKVQFPIASEDARAGTGDDEAENESDDPSQALHTSDEESDGDSGESTSEDDEAVGDWVDEEDALQYSAL